MSASSLPLGCASAWTVCDGWIDVPDAPGFGLELDKDAFEQVAAQNGFTLGQ